LYDKTIEGMKKFGWSKKFVYQCFFSLGGVNTQIKYLDKLDNNEDPPCDCYYDLGCPFILDQTCEKSLDCKKQLHNCGFFGNTTCEGFCD